MVNTTHRIRTHVVEASTNRPITILTSTIGISKEIACTSPESLDDAAICRNCALFCTADVQVDGRRAFVVYGVLTHILPRQGSGQDGRSENEWKEGSEHV